MRKAGHYRAHPHSIQANFFFRLRYTYVFGFGIADDKSRRAIHRPWPLDCDVLVADGLDLPSATPTPSLVTRSIILRVEMLKILV